MAKPPSKNPLPGYDAVLGGIVELLESARRASARTVNTIMTATYWEVGRRLVEHEQAGQSRAQYGQALLKKLSADLGKQFRRGFSERNLEYMRLFYLGWPISQTPSAKSPTSLPVDSGDTLPSNLAQAREFFPLPWSHYVRLLSVQDVEARRFYETEALHGGWSLRQLKRQIGSQFYERAALSKDKASILKKGQKPKPEDTVTAAEEIKDPFVLEFLDLKDEYSESDLEDALIHRLEEFLLELGGDFAFIGRQRRLRIGDSWFRVDLLFFHRRLRCLVIIDLKLDKFAPADVGQMHTYLNYAKKHWTHDDENPPVGLILCASKDHAVAEYALEDLPNQVLAAEYRTALPDGQLLADELAKTRTLIEERSRS